MNESTAKTPKQTTADLVAIRARAEAATPGPWRYNLCPNEEYASFIGVERNPFHTEKNVSELACCRTYDAEFIAHAREDIPALLDALEALATDNARLQNRIRGALRFVSEYGDHRAQLDKICIEFEDILHGDANAGGGE